MISFLCALAVFLALHSVPAIAPIRQKLIALLGRRLYLILYSLASLLALGWVFHSAFKLDYVELWQPAAWQAWVPLVLSPLAFFLLIAGLISPNPASVSFRKADDSPGAILTVTRHPVLWGFVLWSVSHVVPNGDLRSLILFGTLALFSLFGIAITERRANKRQDERIEATRRATSIIPFVAMMQGRTRLRFDAPMAIAFLAAAAITTWLLLGGHAKLFGADPLALALS